MQTRLHMRMRTCSSSFCKFDCSRHYLLYHKDVLKLEKHGQLGTIFNISVTIWNFWQLFTCEKLYIMFNLLCKFFYLPLTRIQPCRNIHATPFSYYKVDCIHLYLLYHKDVLKL